MPPKPAITIPQEIQEYNSRLEPAHRTVCDVLAEEISRGLPAAQPRIWHSHPVWFLEGNPIVGYSRQKAGIRLMFWSGADFEEPALHARGEKFKDASVFFNDSSEIPVSDLRRWLRKSTHIRWDYKNLVRRKGRLERLS